MAFCAESSSLRESLFKWGSVQLRKTRKDAGMEGRESMPSAGAPW